MFTYTTRIIFTKSNKSIKLRPEHEFGTDLEEIFEEFYASEIAEFIFKNPFQLIGIDEKEFQLAIVDYLYKSERWDKLSDATKMKVQKYFEENNLPKTFPERIRWQNISAGNVWSESYYDLEVAEDVYESLWEIETDEYTTFWSEESFWDYIYYPEIDLQPTKEDELNLRDKAILKELRENGPCIVFWYHRTEPTETPEILSEKEPVLKKIDKLESYIDNIKVEVVI